LPEITRPILRYGIDSEADVCASNIHYQGSKTTFDVLLPDAEEKVVVTLNMPGRHNVLNALAAICVAYELGVSVQHMQTALAKFEGIGRRMHMYGEAKISQGEVTIVDDYAHHPTEVAATLNATKKAWPDKRLVAIFQPHRYTRTRDLFEDFSQVLADCDVLILTEIYAAGEEPIAGADGRALCAAIRARGKVNPVFIEDVEKLGDDLRSILQDGDLVLTMGAGSIGRVVSQLKESLEAKGVTG
jgi:UDP-N-acetylmuramate--alanine ligase